MHIDKKFKPTDSKQKCFISWQSEYMPKKFIAIVLSTTSIQHGTCSVLMCLGLRNR